MFDELTTLPIDGTPQAPEPEWIELWDGKKLLGKFDPERFVLRTKNRGRFVYFDLADMIRRKEAQQK